MLVERVFVGAGRDGGVFVCWVGVGGGRVSYLPGWFSTEYHSVVQVGG